MSLRVERASQIPSHCRLFVLFAPRNASAIEPDGFISHQ